MAKVVEIKTKSLKKIITQCNSLGWDINDVEFLYYEDMSYPDKMKVGITLRQE